MTKQRKHQAYRQRLAEIHEAAQSPLVEGVAGLTRMQVQNEYSTTLNMMACDSLGGTAGRSRQAIRMTERRLGISNIQVSSDTRTVVAFTDPRNVTEGLFNTIADPDVPEVTRLRRVNAYLAKIGNTYHQGVPINEIINNLKLNGFEAVQEDGTAWEGLILGKDATWHIDLVDLQTGKPSRRQLHVTHHKMEVSGNYEITAYVN